MTFNTEAATAHYIDGLGADALAKAAAYTTGGHWLLLWGLLVTALVTWLIVRSGLLQRVDRRLGRRGPNFRAFVIGIVFFLVSALLRLPCSGSSPPKPCWLGRCSRRRPSRRQAQ